MRFALHVTLTVQERLVYASLSGFGVDQHSRQRKGIIFIFFVNVAAPADCFAQICEKYKK
jgi:hypothetical protein